jgi:hypothetical protein
LFNKRALLGLVSTIIFLLASSTVALAQFEAGSVAGTVKDDSGAVIPNAAVEVRNVATGVVRSVATSGGGQFDFVAVAPGQYSATAKLKGFRDHTLSFQLSVGQRLDLDMVLTIGEATEAVTVNTTQQTVETASSEIGNVRTQQQVQDLPLNSRNFTQLVGLSPGVNLRGNSNNSQALGYTSGRGTNGAIINGNPGEETLYLFDGIQSVNNDIGAVIFFPPVDAIQEFKVQTSGATAAYGGSPAIINVTFRSGTNAFHGTAYEFLRNSALDAKNYFDNHSLPIVPFHMNEFGANLSGPVILPHLFNGRNKLFFFMDYEGKRVDQAQTYTSTVPTAAFRTGDFSALMPSTGCTAVKSGSCLSIPGTSTLLPNNQIPQNMIDPTALKLLALFPLPNNGTGLVNNYLLNGTLTNNIDQGDLRIDYRTEKTNIFGRFSKENPLTISPGYLPSPAVGGGPSRPGTTTLPGEQIVFGYGRSFGSNKYYEARLAWSRLYESIVIANNNQPSISQQYGIPNANITSPGLTNISITGQVGLGDGNGNLPKVDNNWEIDQAFSLVKGNHEFKAGFDFLSRRQASEDPAYPAGQFTFSGVYTGYGFADFLYGHPLSSTLGTALFISIKRYTPSFYLQDNYRATSKLLLTFGVRDDLVTPWKERSNRLAAFDPTGAGSLIPVGTTPQFPNGAVTDGRYTNIGPRFGFAYTLDTKTVLRGGAGIYYANENITSAQNEANNAPFFGSYVTTNSSGLAGFNAAAPISTGFPSERPLLYPTAGTNVIYYPKAYKNATTNEYSLNLQRELTSHDVLSVAYVGQTASHILAVLNINQPAPGAGSVGPRRPYPNFATISEVCQCADSAFNSLQVSYRAHFPGGLDFLGAYTYSHSIDDSSGTGNLSTPQNPFDIGNTFRGNSDFDIRHNATLSWTYDFPFGRNKRFLNDSNHLVETLIGGWQLNSIDTFQTGTPFTPVEATSLLNTGSSVQYPNRVPGKSGKLANPTPQEWFDITAFTSPGPTPVTEVPTPAPTFANFGNSGRNILFGPGTKQIDASLFKNFAFNSDGTRHLQLRVEGFNVFNTPQFNNPNVQLGVGAAGQITSAGAPSLFARTSREIQLAGKFYF